MARWLLAGLLTLLGTTAATAQQGLWEVYHDAGAAAERRGYPAEAEKLWKVALEMAAKDPAAAIFQVPTLENLARIYTDQGRLSDTETILKKILEINETKLGKEAPAVATACMKLAEFYQLQFGNREAEVEPYIRRALAMQAKDADLSVVFGPGLSLFGCCLFQNKVAEAEQTIRWCLDVVEKQAGPMQANARAACLHGLAMVHYKRRQDTEAEAAYRRALEGLEKAHGPNDPALLWTLYQVGNFYHVLLGRTQQAEFFYGKALIIGDKAGVASSGQTAQILLALGQIRHARKDADEAKKCFDRALEMAEHVPDQASAGDKLGVAVLRMQALRYYLDLGKFAEAEALCKKAVADAEAIKGTPKKELGRCYRGMADCYLAQNKLAEAEAFAKKAVESDEKVLGGNHGAVALDQCRLAKVARLRNQDAEAEKLCKLALTGAQREIGITRMDVREVFEEYAALLKKMNRAAEAQQVEARIANELKLTTAPTGR